MGGASNAEISITYWKITSHIFVKYAKTHGNRFVTLKIGFFAFDCYVFECGKQD